MKLCPNCSANNWPDAIACFACGHVFTEDRSAPPAGAPDPSWEESLFTDAVPPGPEPTQPRRVRPGAASPRRPAWDDAGINPHRAGLEDTRPRRVNPAPAASQNYTPPPPAAEESLFPPGSIPVLKPDRSRIWRAAAFVLATILVCAGAFAIYTLGVTVVNATREATARIATQAAEKIAGLPINQPTTTPAAEVFVTPTPWPTFTLLPPTAVANPQPIPDFFATATPGPDLTRYLTTECASALEHLKAANQAFSDNPAAPFDQVWRDDLSRAVSEMKTYCSTLESASPVPGQIEEAHAYLNFATEAFDNAGRLLKESADEANPAKFVEAGGQLVQAGIYLRKALTQMGQLGNGE